MKMDDAKGKAKAMPSSPEDAALGEAFDAAKDGDREGFVSAVRAAIRACIDSYGPEEEAEEEA